MKAKTFGSAWAGPEHLWQSALVVVLATLSSGGLWADAASIANAIAAKETEMRWNADDLDKAQRDLTRLQSFVESAPTRLSELRGAIDQLEAAEGRLSTIQQQNLVKLTIRMGLETYNTISDSISLGKGAATAFVRSGVGAAVGEVVYDRAQNYLTDQGKTALGMDAASLSRPRTVALNAVNERARQTYAPLRQVQFRLDRSLEDVKAQVLVDEGVELGDTGAILRKGVDVRAAMALAIPALEDLALEAETACTQAEADLAAAQTVVTELTQKAQRLIEERQALERELEAARQAEIAAEIAAQVPPFVTQPNHTVSVPAEPSDTYVQRHYEALLARARAVWETNAPPLIAAIRAEQAALTTLQQQLDEISNTLATRGAEQYLFARPTGDRYTTPGERSNPASLAADHAALLAWQEANADSGALYAQGQAKAAAYVQHYAEAQDLQTRLQEQIDLLQRYLAVPGYDSSWFQLPGRGPYQEEDWQRQVELWPNASTYVAERAAETEECYGALVTGLTGWKSEWLADLAAAESALEEMASAARQYEALLATVPEATIYGGNFYGYWRQAPGYPRNSANYESLLRHGFSPSVYSKALALLLTSDDGVAGARALADRYLALAAAVAPLQQRYDVAWQRFNGLYSELRQASAGESVPALGLWQSATQVNPRYGSGVDATALEARWARLLNTVEYYEWVDMQGNPWQPGGNPEDWRASLGVSRLRLFPEIAVDDPAQLVMHRLLALRERLAIARTTWLALTPTAYDAAYWPEWLEASDLHSRMGELLYAQFSGDYLSSVYIAEHQTAVLAAYRDLSAVTAAYRAAHPPPTITSEPEDIQVVLPPGSTYSGSLTVSATGEWLEYRWERTQWPDYPSSWEAVVGATGPTLDLTGTTDTWHYRCVVKNYADQVLSRAIRVSITILAPPAEFTSPAAASATVGQPFTWTFASNPPGHWWSAHTLMMGEGPPGLTLDPMTGVFSGTPTQGGVWSIPIMVFAGPSMGQQDFVLTVAGGPSWPTGYVAWLERTFGAGAANDPDNGPLTATPHSDGCSNLLKFATGMAADRLETTRLGVLLNAPGGPRLEYRRCRTAAAGVALVVEAAPSLAGPWDEFTPATEDVTVTELDDGTDRLSIRLPTGTALAFYRLRARLR